jgi:hypothetical protein
MPWQPIINKERNLAA